MMIPIEVYFWRVIDYFREKVMGLGGPAGYPVDQPGYTTPLPDSRLLDIHGNTV